MGLFWSYFKGTLRLPFLFGAGPLVVLVQGAARSLDEVREIILGIRDQFLAARCEDANLTRYGGSRGITRSTLEPKAYWTARVRYAYHWWARGGRQSAMAEGLTGGFGFESAEVVNMRAEDAAKWASFRVVMKGGAGDVLLHIDQVRWAISEVKPARSKLLGLKFYAPDSPVQQYSGIASNGGSVTTIYPLSSTSPVDVDANWWRGISSHGGTVTTIYPGGE